MRPSEFTAEQIIAAGEELQQEGAAVTGFALRQRVGGGNPTRLKQVWDAHVVSQSQAEPMELPPELAQELAGVVQQLNKLAAGLNGRAVKAAQQQVQEALQAAAAQRMQADAELADAARLLASLEDQLQEAKAGAVVLDARLVEAQQVNQAQAVEIAQLRERLAADDYAGRLDRNMAVMTEALKKLSGGQVLTGAAAQ